MEASRVRVLASLSALVFSTVVFAVAGLFVDRQLQALLDDRLAEALLAQAKSVAGAVFLENTTDSVALALATGTLSETREQTGAELVVLLDARGRVLFTDPPVLGERPYIDLDNAALASAITGKPACGERFRIGNVDLKTAFAPVFSPFGEVVAIVGIEAPADFFGALRDVRRALVITLGLGMALVAGLVVVVWHFWARSEASERALWDSQQLAMIGQMTATMAHEVRNPLSAFGMHLGLLRRRYMPEGADSESFREIQGQLEQLKILVDRFLGYSREVKPVPERFRPAELLRDAISARVPTGGRADVRCPEGRSVEMDGDIMMWRQIVENLIDNAVFACYPKPVEINIEIYTKNDMICIRFADAGPGVPRELVPRLFTPFSTGRPGGHGIGLALVRKFVEAQNGTIRYEAAPAGGAVFLIEVPGSA